MLEDKAHNLITELGGLLPLIVSNTLNALGAVLILLVGLWLSGRADLLVVRMFRRTPHFDPMLQSFFGSLARYMVLTLTVLAVLSEFGIQTTSLVAILVQSCGGCHASDLSALSDQSQSADRRQHRNRQSVVAILDRIGHRRPSAGDRAEQ